MTSRRWDDLLASKRDALPWWLLARADWSGNAVVTWHDRRWWVLAWWRLAEGPFWRFLIACGCWQTGEGSYYRTGYFTWQNRYARTFPDWPRDGREFWCYVLGVGDAFPDDLRPDWVGYELSRAEQMARRRRKPQRV